MPTKSARKPTNSAPKSAPMSAKSDPGAAVAWADEFLMQAEAERKEGFSKPLIVTVPDVAHLRRLRDVAAAAAALAAKAGAKLDTAAGAEARALNAALARAKAGK